MGEEEISDQMASIYRLSGDYNPLHIDPKVAQSVGFPKCILRGLCTFGHSIRMALSTLSESEQNRVSSVQCRFSHPVIPRDVISVAVYRPSPEWILFESVSKNSKKPVISGGAIRLNDAEKSRL